MNTGQSVYVNVWIYGYVWMYVWGGQSKRSAKEDASLLKITFFFKDQGESWRGELQPYGPGDAGDWQAGWDRLIDW